MVFECEGTLTVSDVRDEHR